MVAATSADGRYQNAESGELSPRAAESGILTLTGLSQSHEYSSQRNKWYCTKESCMELEKENTPNQKVLSTKILILLVWDAIWV